jgi:hypothetical protein
VINKMPTKSAKPEPIPIRKVGPKLPMPDNPIITWPKPPVTHPGVIRPRKTDGNPDDAKRRAR